MRIHPRLPSRAGSGIRGCRAVFPIGAARHPPELRVDRSAATGGVFSPLPASLRPTPRPARRRGSSPSRKRRVRWRFAGCSRGRTPPARVPRPMRERPWIRNRPPLCRPGGAWPHRCSLGSSAASPVDGRSGGVAPLGLRAVRFAARISANRAASILSAPTSFGRK